MNETARPAVSPIEADQLWIREGSLRLVRILSVDEQVKVVHFQDVKGERSRSYAAKSEFRKRYSRFYRRGE